MSAPVVFPSEAAERQPRPQASSALYAALAANTERFAQPFQYAIPPLQTNGLPRRLSSAAYDSASSGLPSPTWPTPPHTPSKLLTEPKPLLLPPPLSSAASPIRASPRANPRRLSNASARFSRRVSLASAYSLSRPPSSARLQSRQVSMLEATLHGSLPVHPNVVSLHAALESPSCLFLVLEYVRGPDLFYFLEQSRDALPPSPLVEEHEFTPRAPSYVPEPTQSGHHTHTASHSARTPPTPSLLSALGPSFILSPTRLRLIASMFRQMCGAVAACHEHGVSHRDIKPENFIVTDAWVPVGKGENGHKQRKVVVKLSDFGLATNEVESSDMDCGSAPYMSYECRNNCAPTYNPRAADVWSLGIVLINMLYHVNPWADTFDGACPSFTAFRADPINFFITRFAGMTYTVARFFATRVFCIPDSGRIDAAGLGEWVKNLTAHFDVGAMGEFEGSVPVTPVMGAVVLGGLPVQREGLIDVEGAREVLESGLGLMGVDGEGEGDIKEEADGEVLRTTTSGARKRGKRGARKNKNAALPSEPSTPTVPTIPIPAILGDDPAAKVQDLARELSKQSVPSRTPSLNPPVVMDGVPWEIDALPRQQFPRGPDGRLMQGHIHGAPRNKAPRPLGTISEQPPFYRRADGSGSNVGLDRQRSASPEVPKKVQKGQINTLKGMLRAFGAGARD
ncbi:hypothetical protein FRC07_004904 [Ceratobasidium sp. 392]|nr:hypothetical protein FRC07_004904 [Ceratobasidium sp. 392]